MHMCTYDTEWRRYIEGLKLHISFRKNAINYRALLQKMISKDKASYVSTLTLYSLIRE